MKPIKLVMEGFGPYLEKTEIDFEKMDNGLTLISGNTGSGKTTIFDAICCALYGETSGKNRSFTQMRSKSAEPTDKTRIYFEFELRGKKYIVERSPKFLRPKRNSNELTEEAAKATLVYPDGRTVTKVSTVTNEVKDLLGIGKDEFRQIVMIAQNDFMAMIKDTKANQEITFNRIFGTQIYRDFITKVKHEVDTFENRRDQVKEQIQMELSRLGLEELSTDTNLFTGQIIEALSIREDSLKEKLPQLEAEVIRLDQEVKASLKLIEHAKLLKQQFTELKVANNRRTELNKQKESIDNLIYRTQRAEDARDGVEGIYNEFCENKKHLSELEQQLKIKRQDYRTALARSEQYSEKLKNYPQDKLIQMRQEEKELEGMIPVYQEAADLNKTLIELRLKRDQLIQSNEVNTREKDALSEKLKSLVIYSDEYFSDLRNKNEANRSNYRILFERIEELMQILVDLKNFTSSYINESNRLVNARVRLKDTQKEYDSKFDIYISNQAHFLAEKLKPDEPCPVCGSLEHPHPATLTSDKNVTIEELEELESELNSLRKSIQNISHSVDQDEGKITAGKDSLEKYYSLFNEKNKHFLESYKTGLDLVLSDPTSKENKKNLTQAGKDLSQCLEQIQEAVAFELSEYERKAREIDQNESVNQKLIQEKEKLEKQQGQQEEVIEDQKNQIAELNEKISAQQVLYEEKKKVLSHASLKEAQEALNNKKEQIEIFIKGQEQIQSLEKEATELVKQLEGEGKALSAEGSQAKKRIEENSVNLSKQLRENNFNDLKDFLNSRLSPDEINQNNKKIQDYHFEVKSNYQTIGELSTKLKGKIDPDMKKLEEEENSLNEALKEKRTEFSQTELELKKLDGSKQVIEERLKIYRKISQEYDVLFGLDRMINKRGATFSQYVLSVYFKKILRKANIKLAEMTNGLYQFKQPKEGQLEIAIFDASTGTTRDIKTLSGGETFTASLALALGFSEVVEEQNGGVRLDTIFIDEGFGSLDPEYLERAIDVLSKLSTERRVAIISHVEQLKERIDQQIVVEKGKNSSRIKLITR